MADHTRTYHVGINVDHASRQMIPALRGSGMITIFPVGAFSVLSLIELLPRSSGHQLHGIGDHVPLPIIHNEQVNMVGCDHVVQNRQTIALLGLIQPLQIPMPILLELEEEFSLMASMSDMPDVARV